VSLPCPFSLLPLDRHRTAGNRRSSPNRYRPIRLRHVACPVSPPQSNQSKTLLNSNSNPCFVADLVKSLENRILGQKLQIIPRWNP
jgi:hypothetical protein